MSNMDDTNPRPEDLNDDEIIMVPDADREGILDEQSLVDGSQDTVDELDDPASLAEMGYDEIVLLLRELKENNGTSERRLRGGTHVMDLDLTVLDDASADKLKAALHHVFQDKTQEGAGPDDEVPLATARPRAKDATGDQLFVRKSDMINEGLYNVAAPDRDAIDVNYEKLFNQPDDSRSFLLLMRTITKAAEKGQISIANSGALEVQLGDADSAKELARLMKEERLAKAPVVTGSVVRVSPAEFKASNYKEALEPFIKQSQEVQQQKAQEDGRSPG